MYPSDNLSFVVLRRKFPELIDAGTEVTFFNLPELSHDFHLQNLTNILESERELATMAFSAALGRTWESPSTLTEEEVKQSLTEDYIRYGVASGEQHASQMIRDLQAAAAKQAQRHLKSR
jgi:hypothetical protein